MASQPEPATKSAVGYGAQPASTAKPAAVVVVDPYSSGRFLLYELKEQGFPIICVRSSLKLGLFFLKHYDKHLDYFAATLDYEEDLQKLISQLGALPYTVRAILPGCEPGVELAERLAEALKLRGNDTALSAARKDKAGMQARLKECGVPSAEQVRASDLQEILEWSRSFGNWPQVVKPTGSSGSDGVFFCQGEEDIRDAHSTLVGQRNPNGIINSELAVQEFLDGDEYIVDTVSRDGKHLCVAVWVYSKRKGTPWSPTCIISEHNRLLPATGDPQDKIVDYVFQVLDAVGLNWGPCHTEVMLTSRGPILVEVNARLHGLQGPHLIGLSTGTSKAAYAVDVMVNEGKLFEKHHDAGKGKGRYLYPVNKHCLQFVIISPVQGYLQNSIKDAILEMNLPSVIEVLPSVLPGQYLTQTTDLNTAAGYVLMVHESAEQLESDKKRLREASDSGSIFKVSEKPNGSALHSPQGSGAASPRSGAQSPHLRQWSEGGSPMSGRSRLHSVEKIDELAHAGDEVEELGDGQIVMSGLEGA